MPFFGDFELDAHLLVLIRLALPISRAEAARRASPSSPSSPSHQERFQIIGVALRVQIALLQQALNEPINQLIQPLIARLAMFIEELIVLLLIEQPGVSQRFADGLAQRFKCILRSKLSNSSSSPPRAQRRD